MNDADLSIASPINLKRRSKSIFNKIRVRLDHHIIKSLNRMQERNTSRIMNEEVNGEFEGIPEMEQDNLRNLSMIKVLQQELREASNRNDQLQQVIDSLRDDIVHKDEEIKQLKGSQEVYRESQKTLLGDLENALTAHVRDSFITFNSVIESVEQLTSVAEKESVTEPSSNTQNVLWSQINEEHLNDDEISEDRTSSDDGLDSIPDLEAHEFEWSEDSERTGMRPKKFTFNEEDINDNDVADTWDEEVRFPQLTVEIDETGEEERITDYVSNEEAGEQENDSISQIDSDVDECKEISNEIAAIADPM